MTDREPRGRYDDPFYIALYRKPKPKAPWRKRRGPEIIIQFHVVPESPSESFFTMDRGNKGDV